MTDEGGGQLMDVRPDDVECDDNECPIRHKGPCDKPIYDKEMSEPTRLTAGLAPEYAAQVSAASALTEAKIKHLRAKAAIAKTYQVLHEYQRQEELAKAELKEAESRMQTIIDKEFNQ